MGDTYNCKVCRKPIGQAEPHHRAGSRGWTHADCVGKEKVSVHRTPAKEDKKKPVKTVKATKPVTKPVTTTSETSTEPVVTE